MSFIGNANNIWIDTFGGPGGGGPPGGVPSWVLRADGIPATLDIDFTTGALWNNGIGNVPAWTLLAGTANNYIPPILDIDFVNDQASVLDYTNIAALLTCTRASTGYYTNAGGFLTSVATNTLRVGDLGLLVEEARTNLVIQSQTFDNAAWNKTNTTITADNTSAPDGTTTADFLNEAATNTQHTILANAALVISNATAYTFSFYAKANGRNFINALGDSAGNLGSTFCAFDLSGAGTVNATGAGVTSATITALANGWYRIVIVATSTGVAAQPIIGLRTSAGGTALQTYLGVVGQGVFIWGAQLEAGAFPTSYIPTTTVSVTRAADDVSTAIGNIQFNQAAGTMVARVTPLGLAGGSGSNVVNFDQDGNNTVTYAFISSTIVFRVFQAGSNIFLFQTGATEVANVQTKLGMAWITGDQVAYQDGANLASASGAMVPFTVTNLYLGAAPGWYSSPTQYLSRLTYWNTRRSNAALASVTT